MRKAKLIWAAVLAMVAVSAVASATASAAAPEFTVKTKFTDTSGSGTLALTGGNTIVCRKDKSSGEITGGKTVTDTIEFEECTIFGFIGAESLGASNEKIIVKAKGELCFISESAKQVGMFLEPEPVHIEAAGALAKVEGTLVGEVTPSGRKTKTGELKIKTSGGKQEFTKCGTKTASLTGSENEGATKEATEATSDTITFEKETEVTN
jgi:hypothetical protein